MTARKFLWFVVGGITLFLIFFYLIQPVQLAGDIAEYYGITESLINHQGIQLTFQDQERLEQVLHADYFTNPGYYIESLRGGRYPVHFFFYSLIATFTRLVLVFLGLNQLTTLAVTNVLLFSTAIAFLFRFLIRKTEERFVLLVVILLSPLAFFFAWPGPDLFYTLLILTALYLFFSKLYLWAGFVTVIASWHSQPLTILVLIFLGVYLWSETKSAHHKEKYIILRLQTLSYVLGIGILWAVPYIYNYLAFGTWTPWTLLRDGWTILNGFGLHNLSLTKLFEQFFDLNIGLFWYAPLILLGGGYYFLKSLKYRQTQVLFIGLTLTAFAYQTNPAWHYGTAGFGPTRHILFALPFFIYFLATHLKPHRIQALFLSLLVVSQLFILSTNGFFMPNFQNTLRHSVLARFVLTSWPHLYNPTPEIFVDRTNQTDLGHLTSAVFKVNSKCRKVFTVKTDVEQIKAACGDHPLFTSALFDNEFLRKTNVPRTVVTTDATFWPDSASCEEWYIINNRHPYQCMKTINDVATLTGLTDLSRVTQVENNIGVWRIEYGPPAKLTVPPGYIIHHTALEGNYITYD